MAVGVFEGASAVKERPRSQVAPLVLLLVLAVVPFWQVLLHPTSRLLLGGGDGQLFLWQWWHLPHALSQGSPALRTTDQFYPVGVDLSATTSVPAIALGLAPVRYLVGPAAEVNLAQIGATVATALCAYALAWRVTRDRVAAVVAAACFALAPFRWVHVNHLNLQHMWLVPLAATLILRMTERPTVRRGALVGLVLGVSPWFDPQLAVVAGVTVVVLAAATFRARTDTSVVLATAAPTRGRAPHRRHRPRRADRCAPGPGPSPGRDRPGGRSGASPLYSSDVLSWIVPSPANPIIGGLVRGHEVALLEGLAAPGLVLLILALFGRERGGQCGA